MRYGVVGLGHIAQVARSVVERVGSLSSRHTIETHFPETFPEVYADPDKIQQVLTNLVENALKYTSSGRVCVTGSSDGSTVQVAVAEPERVRARFRASVRHSRPRGQRQ